MPDPESKVHRCSFNDELLCTDCRRRWNRRSDLEGGSSRQKPGVVQRLSHFEVRKIARLHDEGLAQGVIALKVGRTTTTVRNVLSRKHRLAREELSP